MTQTLSVIGMGLIGSSITRAVQQSNAAGKTDFTIIAADINPDVTQKVVELGIADFATDNLAEAVETADIVILCVPVGAMAAVAKDIAPHLKDGAIVSDSGSVKGSVIKAVTPFFRSSITFVPAHPIAGTELSGPEAGFPELFDNRWCVITPLPDTPIKTVEQITRLWEAFGSRVEIMDVKHHDLVLSITSHLPHLIAYTIVGTATELEDDLKSEVVKYSASGFRDFTRLASSDPVMWRDISLNNKDSLLEMLQRFTEDLTALQKAIRKGDGDYLYRRFSETRGMREAIIEQGQARFMDKKKPTQAT